MNSCSDKIKEIRKSLGISVPKLAERINIPARTIVSYEGGRTPSLEFVSQICNILNINANWFILGKGEMFLKEQTELPHQRIDEEQIKNVLDKLLAEKGII